MEIGSLAELLSAGGTLAALIAAGIAAHAAIKTNNQQGKQLRYLEEENRQRERQAESAQAERAAVWMRLDSDRKPVVVWLNASGLPVYAATYYVASADKLSQTRYSFGGPRDSSFQLRLASNRLRDDFGDLDWEALLDDDQLRVAVQFRDTANRWWLRDFAGQLHRHQDETGARSGMLVSLREFMPDHPAVAQRDGQ